MVPEKKGDQREWDEVFSSIDSRTPIGFPEEQGCGNSDKSDLVEIHAHIQSAFKKYFSLLPTKADIQDMFLKLETAHKADMQEIKAGLHSPTNRLDQVEVIVPSVKSAIAELQAAVVTQLAAIQTLFTYLEDLEDRGRRNNIRIRGLPEKIIESKLKIIAVEVFN